MFSIRSTRKIKHSYKTTKLQKKSIHDICCISYKTTKLQKKVFMIYVIHVCLDVALMEKGICTPLWFLKNTHHPCTSQNILPNNWVKKKQNLLRKYIRCAPASKTRFGSLGGISFRLLWQPLPLVALVLVCSGSLRMEADRADSWQSL